MLQTRFGGGSTAVAVYTAGVPAPAFAGSARNASDGTIELSVPWSSLGLAGPPESPLRFTVATFRSTLDDAPREVGDASVPNALDVVSDYGDPGTAPNTSSEFATDQIVDYFSDVYFTSAGEVEAPVVISRFSPNQANAAAEFVEVANASSVTVNLSSFKLGDEASTTADDEGMHSFPVGTTLAAGSRVVVARSGAAYQTAFAQLPDFELEPTSAAPDMNQFGVWSVGAPDFADPGEELLVLDRANTIVDVVTYGVPPVAFPGLVPKTPAPAPGDLQKRMPSLRDTDDNQTDFSLTSCAGSKTFDGGPAGTGTQWDLAANWSGDTLPAAGDNVCIPNLAIPGVVFDSGTHNVQSITSEEPFTVSAGVLNVNSLVQPSTLASLTLTGGTMGGGGHVDVTNTFTWSSGTMTRRRDHVRERRHRPRHRRNEDPRSDAREQRHGHVDRWADQHEHACGLPQSRRPDARHPGRRHDRVVGRSRRTDGRERRHDHEERRHRRHVHPGRVSQLRNGQRQRRPARPLSVGHHELEHRRLQRPGRLGARVPERHVQPRHGLVDQRSRSRRGQRSDRERQRCLRGQRDAAGVERRRQHHAGADRVFAEGERRNAQPRDRLERRDYAEPRADGRDTHGPRST